MTANFRKPRLMIALHAFIDAYTEEKKYPPSLREIAKQSGVSTHISVIKRILVKMEQAGMCTLVKNTARGITTLPRENWDEWVTREAAQKEQVTK
jgi:DNA-binding transcriptional regulator YhcF (GntR family)